MATTFLKRANWTADREADQVQSTVSSILAEIENEREAIRRRYARKFDRIDDDAFLTREASKRIAYATARNSPWPGLEGHFETADALPVENFPAERFIPTIDHGV